MLCTMAVIRGLQAFKSASSFFRGSLSLVDILIRDSVFYFFMHVLFILPKLIADNFK